MAAAVASNAKLAAYAANGCPHYWVVDPDEPSVVAFRLAGADAAFALPPGAAESTGGGSRRSITKWPSSVSPSITGSWAGCPASGVPGSPWPQSWA
ncbi:MAG: Uma2 family endonuclease [Acidimicrobiales bacterium]